MTMIMGMKEKKEEIDDHTLSILSLPTFDDIDDVRNYLFLALRMEMQLRNLDKNWEIGDGF